MTTQGKKSRGIRQKDGIFDEFWKFLLLSLDFISILITST
jgi:hypothetical protein